MSRLAKKPIEIPNKVEVTINDNTIIVKGPKGELKRTINERVLIQIENNEINVKPNLELMKRTSEAKHFRAMTGTFCSHIKNMIIGVTEGFKKELTIVGVGYRAALKGKTLNMNLGYAHEVNVEPPENITFEVPKPNQIIVNGIDKEVVGQIAANIRGWREPLVYGGKGIRYVDEIVRTKVGKKV
ncbi:MAG TPA: 50S ribosomal protein L6 [Thermotogota bacterium]|nr:50S ribosomal protein L6 [Thermotogota bacterium]HRW33487.1 50S ribosomal protein L6 [Thermotogota bacterium]